MKTEALIAAGLVCFLTGCDFELPSQRQKKEEIRRESIRQEQKKKEVDEVKGAHTSLVQFVTAQTRMLTERSQNVKKALSELTSDRVKMSQCINELSEKSVADKDGSRESVLYMMLADEKLNALAMKYLGTDFAVLRSEFAEKVRRAIKIEKTKKDSLARNEAMFNQTVESARLKAEQVQKDSARAEQQLGREIAQIEQRRKSLHNRLNFATQRERTTLTIELNNLTSHLNDLRRQYNVARMVVDNAREQRAADRTTQFTRDNAQRAREKADAAVIGKLKGETSPHELAEAYEEMTVRKLDATLLEKNRMTQAEDKALESSLLYLKHVLAGAEMLDLAGIRRLRGEIETKLDTLDISREDEQKPQNQKSQKR